MLVDIFKDIQSLKKDYEKNGSNTGNRLSSEHLSKLEDSAEFESSLNSIYSLLQSMEVINNDVVNNKNLLKNVLDKDHEEKKRCIERIKSIINAYVNIYDFIDGIRQAIQKSSFNNDMTLINTVNSLLRFLEKEYLEVGLTVYAPNVDIDKFDKSKHEIAGTERNITLSNDTITQVLKKGFYYNDRNIRFIRTARVITVLN